MTDSPDLLPRHGTPPVPLHEYRAREMAKAVDCRVCGTKPICRDRPGEDAMVYCTPCFVSTDGSGLPDAVREWNRINERKV